MSYRKLTDTHNIDRPNPMMKGFGLSMFIFLVVAIPIAPTPTIIKLRNLPAHNLVTFKAKFNFNFESEVSNTIVYFSLNDSHSHQRLFVNFKIIITLF